MFDPRPEIASPTYAVAPSPIDCMITTAATPITMPSVVSSERILLRISAAIASDEVAVKVIVPRDVRRQ